MNHTDATPLALAALKPPMHPTFVYGTLRPNQGNDRLWKDEGYAIADGYAWVEGFRLVTQGFYPYAIPDASESITGALIAPDPDCYDGVMARLDRLEGVPMHYKRVLVPVMFVGYDWQDLRTEAWLYVPADPTDYAHLDPVRENDWALHRAYTRTIRSTP